MKIVKLKQDIYPSALKVAREYRGYTQTELCKEIKGLSQPNLSMFEKGDLSRISRDKLKEIIEFLEFPFSFLSQEFKPLKTSHGYI